MIQPYKNARAREEMCWLLDERRALHESFLEIELTDVDDTMNVWASNDLVTGLLARGLGEALCWENKIIRWKPSGTKQWIVRVLRTVCPDDPEVALLGLCAWRDWLMEYGAAPAGSLGGSGMSLLKATLKEPLWTSAGDPPPITFTLGGRQVIGPRGAPAEFHGPLRHWDMQAAYARTLGNLRYGGWWRRIEDLRLAERLARKGPQRMMFIRARVRLPDQEWAPEIGPLPARPRSEPRSVQTIIDPVKYPTGRTLQGIWTWNELQTCENHGGQILRVLDAWHHFAREDSYPFKPWLAAVLSGRQELEGFAGTLAKATGNATWGQFAIRKNARRTTMRVEIHNGRRRRIVRSRPIRGGNPSQRAFELAEYVCAKVRCELYRGMMQADDELVSAHTDGLWLLGSTYVQGWRSKDAAVRMRLIGPQEMAYTRPDGSEVYVVSGVPVKTAEPFFEDEWTKLAGPRPFALREEDRRSRVPTYH